MEDPGPLRPLITLRALSFIYILYLLHLFLTCPSHTGSAMNHLLSTASFTLAICVVALLSCNSPDDIEPKQEYQHLMTKLGPETITSYELIFNDARTDALEFLGLAYTYNGNIPGAGSEVLLDSIHASIQIVAGDEILFTNQSGFCDCEKPCPGGLDIKPLLHSGDCTERDNSCSACVGLSEDREVSPGTDTLSAEYDCASSVVCGPNSNICCFWLPCAGGTEWLAKFDITVRFYGYYRVPM